VIAQGAYFFLLACFALVPPLPAIYGDGPVYNCSKTMWPWVFTVLNMVTVGTGITNLVLYCKYSTRQKELIKQLTPAEINNEEDADAE
jgi:hypothetical protein